MGSEAADQNFPVRMPLHPEQCVVSSRGTIPYTAMEASVRRWHVGGALALYAA
jgi:hypothetical protein